MLLAATLRHFYLARLHFSWPPGLHFHPSKSCLNTVLNGALLPMAVGDWRWDSVSGATYSFSRLFCRLGCFSWYSVGPNCRHGLPCAYYWVFSFFDFLFFSTSSHRLPSQ